MNKIASFLLGLTGVLHVFYLANNFKMMPIAIVIAMSIFTLIYLALCCPVAYYQKLKLAIIVPFIGGTALLISSMFLGNIKLDSALILFILIDIAIIICAFLAMKKLVGEAVAKRTLISPLSNDMNEAFNHLKIKSRETITPTFETRIDRLNRLAAMTEHHSIEILAAINADFGGRSRHLSEMSEIAVVISGCKHMKERIYKHMKTERITTALSYFPAKNRLIKQPKGVVGIMAPWNYPYQLAIMPVVDALAAGNLVMIKPSENTPRTAALMAQLVATYFTSDEMVVITGGLETSIAFSKLPLDHLFFTGSTKAGAAVAESAAKNLTPVTLELGGKSPAILDLDADLARAVPSIAHGRLFNTGQTCISPDYVLTTKEQVIPFKDAYIKAVNKFYPTLVNNPDYTMILNARFFARLAHMVDDAKSKGGEVIEIGSRDVEKRIFPPTLILNATDDMICMQEEIFGPILPVKTIASISEAVSYINSKDRPLSLYYYGDAYKEKILAETVSGGVAVNDCIWHLAQQNQPFGGIGASGQGAYHAEAGLRAFSHEKAVFYQAKRNGAHLIYPPYGATFDKILGLLKKM